MLKTISTITNALGALNYKGTWNASSNTPTLADGTGAKGDYYVVSTAGTQTFGGVQLFFGLGDWIAYNGAVWQRVEGGSDGNFANVTLTSTDAGAAAAPLLELYRDSASPAASDTLGEIEFNGEDSAGNKQAYALFHGSILSPTSGAEQGQLHFETATAGALTEKMIIGTTNLVINEIGAVFNVRIEGDTDANLFYTDATNDKVGLGTASPAEKLDVVGKIKVSDNLVISTSGKGITTGSSIPLGFGTNGSTAQATLSTSNEYRVTGKITSSTNASDLFAGDNGSSAQFAVTNTGVIYAQNTTIQSLSDVRLKENIVDSETGLSIISALRPVRYDWKTGYGNDQKNQLGFIAQEVEEIFPEMLGQWKIKDSEDAYKTIGTTALIPVLVKAIQQQQAMIESLNSKIEALQIK
jgi:hypothetical protein